jgi:anti-sigma factor RsiW
MMNDCANGDLRDLLPGYVHGTLSAAEHASAAAHVGSCEDCAAEVELIRSASRAFVAPRVDVGKIVKALPAAPRSSRRPFLASRVGQLAAAIGIVAIGAFSVIALRGWFGGDGAVQTGGRIVTAPTGDSIVVASVPAPAAAPSSPAPSATPAPRAAANATGISFGGGLSDLTDDQLDTLLGELGALDALPSAEPETHLTPIVPPADGGYSAR